MRPRRLLPVVLAALVSAGPAPAAGAQEVLGWSPSAVSPRVAGGGAVVAEDRLVLLRGGRRTPVGPPADSETLEHSGLEDISRFSRLDASAVSRGWLAAVVVTGTTPNRYSDGSAEATVLGGPVRGPLRRLGAGCGGPPLGPTTDFALTGARLALGACDGRVRAVAGDLVALVPLAPGGSPGGPRRQEPRLLVVSASDGAVRRELALGGPLEGAALTAGGTLLVTTGDGGGACAARLHAPADDAGVVVPTRSCDVRLSRGRAVWADLGPGGTRKIRALDAGGAPATLATAPRAPSAREPAGFDADDEALVVAVAGCGGTVVLRVDLDGPLAALRPGCQGRARLPDLRRRGDGSSPLPAPRGPCATTRARGPARRAQRRAPGRPLLTLRRPARARRPAAGSARRRPRAARARTPTR